MYKPWFPEFVDFVRSLYKTNDIIPLHAPVMGDLEKKYVCEAIDSTYVSSVGQHVNEFEKKIAGFTCSKHAIATVNGTSALHISLVVAGVKQNDEVITQSLSFIATAAAINYCNARPIFLDVDLSTLGLSSMSLREFLDKNADVVKGKCVNKVTGRIIRACVPMHTFGHPVDVDEIKKICDEYCICLVEDAAESLGSYCKHTHTGTIGEFGILSFNGNKTLTTGGGGVVLTNDDENASRIRHLTTTAKLPHSWDFDHDQIGYNYRMPNLNAAFGLAQLERLPEILEFKRNLAKAYKTFFMGHQIEVVEEPIYGSSNYWLNAVILRDVDEQQAFLAYCHENNVFVRPVWKALNLLSPFKGCFSDGLLNTQFLSDRVVNLPSSAVIKQAILK